MKHNFKYKKIASLGKRAFASLLLAASIGSAYATDMIDTNFSSYTTGNLAGQDKWEVEEGTPTIVATGGYENSAAIATNGAFDFSYMAFDGEATGLTGAVYMDMYLKITALPSGKVLVKLYDSTPNSSNKRAFEMEFQKLSDGKGKAKLTSSPSATISDAYTADHWLRLSACIDLNSEKIKFALDGTVVEGEYNLRESWIPANLGRPSGNKEIHYLQISSSDASAQVMVDNVYIGNDPIEDIDFGGMSTERTITLKQPEIGEISINPDKDVYNVGDEITVSCTFPNGYKLTSWTDNLNGNENPVTLTVENNMTIGAKVEIDASNPPAKFKLNITEPEHAELLIEPLTDDTTYYDGTTVKVTVYVDACYAFNGWTGDFSGTQTSVQFKMDATKTIGVSTSLITSDPVRWYVTTSNEFEDALDDMQAGDTIVVADGTYDIGGQSIMRGGCEERPILITAENIGGAILTNESSFTLRNVERVTIRGFKFHSEGGTVIKMESSRYCRITQNEFKLNETSSGKWILIGAHYQDSHNRSWGNRIDHNLFDGKTQGGNYITIDGVSSSHEPSQHDTIDHNHFKNNSPRAENEKESIRVGWTGMSGGSSYTVIEYNLFEDCDGDPEIISLKACHNIVRYNTFRRCLGTVCMRQGAYNRVEGNYFFGEGKTAVVNEQTIGCGGVRVYGIGHVVVNNYFEGLTGDKWDPALAITNGDKANGGDLNNNSHLVPENLVFAHNTMVNNKSNIEVGYDNNEKYGKRPVNCHISNNIIVSDLADCIKLYTASHRSSIILQNNMFYPTGTAQMGVTFTESEILNVNPLLQNTNKVEGIAGLLPCAVYKPQSNSPAINAVSRIAECMYDFEGQERNETTSIGADDLSLTAVKSGALTAAYVGPHAIAFELLEDGTTGIAEENVSLEMKVSYLAGSNTFVLQWHADQQDEIQIYLYNTNGQIIWKGKKALTPGDNTIEIPAAQQKGLYLISVTSGTGHQTAKCINY